MARRLSPGKAAGIAVGAAGVVAATAVAIGVSLVGRGDESAPQSPPEIASYPEQAGPPPASGETSGPTSSGGIAGQPEDGLVQPQGVTTPSSAAAGDIVYQSEALSFSASFPDAPANDPVIAPLRAQAQQLLDARRRGADEELASSRREGRPHMQWEITIDWTYTARAGGIASLLGEASEFTGGAHPVSMFDTHIARIATGEELSVHDMMIVKRAPSPAMAIAMCEALKAEKRERINAETILDEPIICAGPRATWTEEAKYALAPSNQRDRFGGVTAYFAPYAVGSYAEGPYDITIQQSVFAADLRPDMRPLFSGEAP